MNKQRLLVLGVFLLAFFLRFWQLGKSPPGFYSDEALYGYEAFSLLKTGKDQFGNSWPLSIAGFGDYRPALYVYTTIPFIAIFGLNEFATRLPSMLFSFGTVVVSYFLIKKITDNAHAALLGCFIMAISPLSLYFGRMAHETNLMTLLITLGTYFIFKTPNSVWNITIKKFLFAAAMYTYHSARLFVPGFLCMSVVIFASQFKRNIGIFAFGVFLFLMLLIPLGHDLKPQSGLARVLGVGFWSDPGLIPRINEQRSALSARVGNQLGKILINKGTVYPVVFLGNYLTHFSHEFLFTQGDPNGIYNTPHTGILLWIEPLFFFIGGFVLWRKNRQIFLLVTAAIALALVPDSLTRFAPSSARIHLTLPFLSILSGVGMYRMSKKYPVIMRVAIFALLLNSLWFWHNYQVHLPIENERAWQIGTKELSKKTNTLAPRYERIWMSRSCWGWIHVVFDTQYDPATFQREVHHSERNELGFWWVSDFGKYHLEWFSPDGFYEPKTLFAGTPAEFPKGTTPIETVVSPYTDHVLFWITDASHIPRVNTIQINQL